VIPAELVERARDADIVVTAERLGIRLKWGKADERIGCCPACGGDDKLSINIKKKTWSCSRCAKSGKSALSLVTHAHNCGFREAVGFLAVERRTP
jgi:phage/plasmid primase-like uncharacterized protein